MLTTFHTLLGYDFAFSWIFRQDGTIEAEVVLTGSMNSYDTQRPRESVSADEASSLSAVLVAPQVAGPIHQHFCSYRLDFDIDGERNSVVEMNTATLPPAVPRSNDEWFATEPSVLKRELDAKRNIDMESGRWWKIINPDVVTPLGQHPGYALMPGHNSMPCPGPDSAVRRMFGFLDSHLWMPVSFFAQNPAIDVPRPHPWK